MHQKNTIIRLVAFTWLLSKLICLPLWLSTRNFPLVPVHALFGQLPSWVDGLLLAGSFVSMAGLIIFPIRRVAGLLVLVELLACLCDQNRWQPWEYQFLFMTAAYAWSRTGESLIFSWQLICSSIYFFSAVHKFQPAFIHDVWQYLVLMKWWKLEQFPTGLLRVGYSLPVMEISAAILLWLPRLRLPAVITLGLMHMLILLCIGPTGLNINPVIWPWNLAMPLLLWLLFKKPALLPKPLGWFPGMVAGFFILLPILGVAGYWDRNLSFSLYSGGTPQLYVCSTPGANAAVASTTVQQLPCLAENRVSVNALAMEEIKVPPYPETRVYRAIAAWWEQQHPHSVNHYYLVRSGYRYRVAELKL